MGSAILMSKKLHRLHHLVRHACANYVYPCRRNLLTSVNERENIPEIFTYEMEKALKREVSHSLSKREREVSISLYKREREGLIRLNEREREREREGEREAADRYSYTYLLQYSILRHDDKGCYNVSGTQYNLLSTKNWAQTPLRIFQSPHHPNTRRRCRWSYVTGACHGLLHFLDDKYISEEGGRDLLWMPSTNQLKIMALSKVPRLPNASMIRYDSIGLGFNSKSQDYKVVRLVHQYFDDQYPKLYHMQAEVYSLKTDSWKEISDLPLSLDCGYSCSRLHLNGCYYWRYICSDPEEEIFSFNFTTEKFKCLGLPPRARANWDRCDLVGVDGRLGCFMYRSRDGMMQSVELWVLEEEDDDSYGWAKLDFEMENVAGAKDVMMFDSDGDGGVLFIRGVDNGVMVYHIRTGKLEKIATTDQCVYHVSRYRPSFPPLISF